MQQVLSRGVAIQTKRSDSPYVPIWTLAILWSLLPIMLYLAGAGYSPSGDRLEGAAVAVGGASFSPINAIYSYASIVLILIVVAPSYRALIREFLKTYIVLALLIWTDLSAVWSQNAFLSIKGAVLLSLSVAFIYWVRLRFPTDQIMQMLILTGLIIGVLSIVAALAFPAIGLDQDSSGAWQGICYSKNRFGRIIMYLMTPAIHYPQNAYGRIWVRGIYVPFMLVLIVMSHSASALIFAVVYLFVAAILGLLGRFSSKERYLVLALVGPVLASAVLFIVQNSDSILPLAGRDATLTGRTTLWKALIPSIQKRPLVGFGYQAFWIVGKSEGGDALIRIYGFMHWTATYAHNGYLAVILELGMIGLAIVTLLILKAGWDALYCLRMTRGLNYVHWYICIVLLSVLYNVDEVAFNIPVYLPWLMFLLAVNGLSAEASRIRLEIA